MQRFVCASAGQRSGFSLSCAGLSVEPISISRAGLMGAQVIRLSLPHVQRSFPVGLFLSSLFADSDLVYISLLDFLLFVKFFFAHPNRGVAAGAAFVPQVPFRKLRSGSSLEMLMLWGFLCCCKSSDLSVFSGRSL